MTEDCFFLEQVIHVEVEINCSSIFYLWHCVVIQTQIDGYLIIIAVIFQWSTLSWDQWRKEKVLYRYYWYSNYHLQSSTLLSNLIYWWFLGLTHPFNTQDYFIGYSLRFEYYFLCARFFDRFMSVLILTLALFPHSMSYCGTD